MLKTPDVSTTQIVLVGEFEPSTFSPQWLIDNGLMGAETIESADVSILIDSVSNFSIDWLKLFVTRKRFVVETRQAPLIMLSDLCTKIFKEFLPNTQISFMGINRIVQYDQVTDRQRDALGKALAPREPWGSWGQIIDTDEGKGASGMASLTMKQGHGLADRVAGYIEARVGPATKGSGVVINVNDHYERDSRDGKSENLMTRLFNNFEASIRRSDEIVDDITRHLK